MKFGKNIKSLLSNPFVLAIIPAIIVILFLPDIFSKYKVKLIEKRYERNTGTYDYYVDLNNDGIKEHIETNMDSSNKGLLSFKVYFYNERSMEQFNFQNNTFKINDFLFFGDCNNNDLQEVYGFSIRNDSLFLNWMEPFDNSREQDSVFISKIRYDIYGKISLNISEFHTIDLNNDGFPEAVFPIITGYGIIPRAVFAYDMENDSVFSTESVGSPSSNLIFYDIDSDGKPDIICNSSAPNNCINTTYEIPFPDDRLWLKVYNSEMDTLFKPISFPKGEDSGIQCLIDTSNNEPEIDVLYHNMSGIEDKSFFATYDNNGKEIKKVEIELEVIRSIPSFLEYGNEYILFNGLNRVLRITKDFEITDEIILKEGGAGPFIIDLDDNGRNEILMTSVDGKGLFIYSDDFKKLNQLNFDEKTGFNKYIKIEKNKFYLMSENYTYKYSYKLNYLYYIKYPIHLFIYFFFGLIFLGLKKIQESQMRDKLKLKDQVRELQLRTIKNQLNPHFTFNALNVLSGLSREGDNVGVDNFISKFSKMLRSQLSSADNINVSIEEELEFVENYIELQKIRFEKRIDFEIKIDPRIKENTEIPKMLIHTHVENAIKHGLMPKTDGGKIQLDISSFKRGIKITILDNGIGRVKAKEKRTFGTGTGLKVLDEIFDLHYQINKVRIKQTITDLYNIEKQPVGTKVEIIIPRI